MMRNRNASRAARLRRGSLTSGGRGLAFARSLALFIIVSLARALPRAPLSSAIRQAGRLLVVARIMIERYLLEIPGMALCSGRQLLRPW
ncbi:hypothetical protein BDW62DRAFT_38748 [Aspergillus aurantiobrunneus]